MKIAYLGPKGTFTQKAAGSLFSDKDLIPIRPIRNVVRAVENKEVDFGVVPIENFYNGEVRETIDSLTDCSKTKIIKELFIPIKHCLGALPESVEINKIFSKNQALEQCSKYLCENYPEAREISVSSTADAISRIKKENILDGAAIASEEALTNAGFKIIKKDLCPGNKTRFVVLGLDPEEESGDDKTFLVIHPPVDRPGILNDILSIFSSLDINLEYIQSRPDGNKGYYFYVELDGHEDEEKVSQAIQSIKLSLDPKKEHENTVKVLGSYENSHWKNDS